MAESYHGSGGAASKLSPVPIERSSTRMITSPKKYDPCVCVCTPTIDLMGYACNECSYYKKGRIANALGYINPTVTL